MNWHYFGEDVVIFPNISWQRVAEVDILWQKSLTDRMALLCPSSLPTIQERRDNETCRLLDFRSLTNPPDWVISSPKTKGSVIPQKSRIGQEWLVAWGFGKCFTGQNQCKYTVHSCGVGCDERGGLICNARLNRSPSRAPHQSFCMSYMSNQ